MRTILFVFAGRQPNLQIQMPFLQRILHDHPDAEVHLWDLCRTKEDSRYLRTLHGEHVQVRADFRICGQGAGINSVWDHYTQPEYRDCVFVKCDDDLVFLETETFSSFVQAAVDNPRSIISALTSNNGACAPLIPGIWDIFESMDIPLLDVHLHGEFAERCHRWFANNWESFVGQPASLVPASTWLSINCLAMSHKMLCEVAGLIGTPSPPMIADRAFPRRNARGRMSGHWVGDEGAANLLPCLIFTGFTCSHFSFGPQSDHMTESAQAELRKLHRDVAQQYLAAKTSTVTYNQLRT